MPRMVQTQRRRWKKLLNYSHIEFGLINCPHQFWWKGLLMNWPNHQTPAWQARWEERSRISLKRSLGSSHVIIICQSWATSHYSTATRCEINIQAREMHYLDEGSKLIQRSHLCDPFNLPRGAGCSVAKITKERETNFYTIFRDFQALSMDFIHILD